MPFDAFRGMTSGAGTTPSSAASGDKIWDSIIAGGASIVGGLINARGARQANRLTQQTAREEMEQARLRDREALRSRMQSEQDEYQRTVMRNRLAIAPYAQMYSGPRFTFPEGQGPDAPIYNPLMEQGHLFQQLGEAPTGPWTSNKPKPRGRGR